MWSFRHLSALRIISLRGNAIIRLDAYSFADLPLIESIDLSSCRLVDVDRRAFAGCRHLADLSVAGNGLSRLSPAADGHLPAPVVLKRLRVDGNPWLCDCRLRWLHDRLQATAEVGAREPQPVCDAPRLLRRVPWTQLSRQQFACPSRIVAEGRRDITAAAGANVTVRCVAVGDPRPRVRWSRDSDVLPLPSVSRRYDSGSTASDVERLPPWRLVSSLTLVRSLWREA